MTFTHDQSQAGQARRLAAKSEREARREALDGGWLLYPDAPPGIGWVLAPPSTDEHGFVTPGGGNRKRYYSTREAALDSFQMIQAADRAAGEGG